MVKSRGHYLTRARVRIGQANNQAGAQFAAEEKKKTSTVMTSSDTATATEMTDDDDDDAEGGNENADAAGNFSSQRIVEAQQALDEFMDEMKKYSTRLDKYDSDIKEFEGIKSKLDEEERQKRQKALSVRDKSIRQKSEALYDFAASKLMDLCAGTKGGMSKRVLKQLSKMGVDKHRMPQSTIENLSTLVEVSTVSSFGNMNSLAAAEAANKEMQRKWEEERLNRIHAEKQVQSHQQYFDADQRAASLDPKLGMGMIGISGSASAMRADQDMKRDYPAGYRNPNVSVDKGDDRFDQNGNKVVWVQQKPNTTEMPVSATYRGTIRGVPQPAAPIYDQFGNVHQLTLQNSPVPRHQELFGMIQDNFMAGASQGRTKMGKLDLGLRKHQQLPLYQGMTAGEGGFATIPTNADGSWVHGYTLNEAQQQMSTN